MKQIKINFEAAERDVQEIANVASVLHPQELNPKDELTTLSANSNCHIAFAESQLLCVAMGEALDNEVTNARNIGTEFQQYDHMVAELMGAIADR